MRWSFRHRGNARVDMRGPGGQGGMIDARPLHLDGTIAFTFTGQTKSLTLTGAGLNLQSVSGTPSPINAVESVDFALRPSSGNMTARVTLRDVFLAAPTSPQWQAAFGPKIDQLDIYAEAVGLTGLDDNALNRWAQTGDITADNAFLHWGALKLHIRFELRGFGAAWTPDSPPIDGWIRVAVEDGNAALSGLKASGLISPNQEKQFGIALALAPQNEKGHKEIALNVRDGAVQFLGRTLFRL